MSSAIWTVIVTMDKDAKQLSCRRPNPYRPIIPNRGVTHVTGVTEIISGRKEGEVPREPRASLTSYAALRGSQGSLSGVTAQEV
jgi:hypothetical protein